ncbi:PREDICTED: uncharacterized protein LOC104596402 [Nelumbo nucifera]|uniref:Membrane protein PM19L-like n=2 Tax=Nelumbo nucifera TaxID=4432 RepID=A0A822XHG4_NELNU|nr:PREDICTED: uncharacterized protein LOC104596402 [Nelumbo nucifera]DAD19402.1 TPA_asm: hypothetical protein HUJ06_020865 [Nelumbo nucifera]
MASGATKVMAFTLLILNLLMYVIVTIIAGWAINYGIEHTPTTVPIPAHIFPIYFPIGNMATGFFVIVSLIAGLVGIATSVSGIGNVLQWNLSNLLSSASSSILTWSLTLLAMGLACKEINIGWRDANLRTMEVLTIILSGTQLFYMGTIHAGLTNVIGLQRSGGTV